MKHLTRDNILSHMRAGTVLRRSSLLPYSKNLDRDLGILVVQKKLRKVHQGLYYKPKSSRFGELPPSDESLVTAFLRKKFLMYSWNDYNGLGLGLTQLYNQVVVYNQERHGLIKLGNRWFDFKRPGNGFPSALTREFLLVDMLNNSKYLTEDVDDLESRVRVKTINFDSKKLLYMAKKYGKVSTRKFLTNLLGK